jgi:hypothetical protein
MRQGLIGFLFSVAIGVGILFLSVSVLLSVQNNPKLWPLALAFLVYLAIDVALIARSWRTQRAWAWGLIVGFLLVGGVSGLLLAAVASTPH